MSDDRFTRTDPFLDELEGKGYVVIHRSELRRTNFEDVGDFHRKFGLPTSDDEPGPVDVHGELADFRIMFMQEELNEFIEAWEANDPARQFDALLDLAYVVCGTAHVFGFPWQEGWNEVQRANMEKERATRDSMGPRQNAEYDVIKPPHWQPPDIEGVLRRHGWNL